MNALFFVLTFGADGVLGATISVLLAEFMPPASAIIGAALLLGLQRLVIIEFPSRTQAHAWYKSDSYQEILALRTDNSRSDVILVDGVGPGHLATDVLGGPSVNAKT